MFACNVFTSPNDCTYKFIANQLYTVKDADSNATKRFLLASAINKVKNYIKGWGGRPQQDFKLLVIPCQLQTQEQ